MEEEKRKLFLPNVLRNSSKLSLETNKYSPANSAIVQLMRMNWKKSKRRISKLTIDSRGTEENY